MVRHQVKDNIVLFPLVGEVFARVINDNVCAERMDHLHIPRTAHTGYLGAKRLRDLYSKRTHASGGAIDQNLLARLKLCFVPKSLQRGECGHRHRSSLLERYLTRLGYECRLACARILGERTIARSEYLVAGLELRNVLTRRFNLTGDITSRPKGLHFRDPGHYGTQKRVSRKW